MWGKSEDGDRRKAHQPWLWRSLSMLVDYFALLYTVSVNLLHSVFLNKNAECDLYYQQIKIGNISRFTIFSISQTQFTAQALEQM